MRQFLGYERLEHRELLEDLNDLLKLWSTWRNLFCVTMKQESKRREGSRQIRRHEKKGRTPAQRLLDGGELQDGDRKALKEKMIALNPFELREEIRKLENRFWSKRKALYEMEEEESLQGKRILFCEDLLEVFVVPSCAFYPAFDSPAVCGLPPNQVHR